MGRDYCCCAIPLNNTGIYLVLFEQLLVGVLAGTLAFATPQVVSYNGPSIGPIIFGICCYLLAAIQVVGFIGVSRQKSALYLRYQPLNGFILLACFALAGTFVGIAASNHTKAVTACQKQFYSSAGDTSGTANGESETVCNIFTWVGIGCFGGLWLLMVLAQGYFYSIVTTYGKIQREDKTKYHTKYSTINTANNHVAGGPNDIQLAERSGKASDPWDSRPTFSNVPSRQPSDGPTRQASTATGAMSRGAGSSYEAGLPPGAAAPRRQATNDTGYNTNTNQGYADPYADQTGYNYSGYGYNAYPSQAHVAQDQPTPVAAHTPSIMSYGGETVVAPAQSKYHPAEGSMGRKTPRNDTYDAPPYPFAPEFQQSSASSHDGGSVKRH
ncbi:hypothetical protein BKA62DRAFT_224216 [Auriculariales sp. MPI-PUGE-AT-0066]|nr:hypothetical protein BKA62DRAFT_224216 [Auriculariales sp. MPI-PUGE-AT-0066]